MTIRILKVLGDNDQARQDYLHGLQDWMGRHGWQFTDYSPEACTALFERPPEAPISRLHPTRWLPGPDVLRPAGLWRHLRAEPRIAVALLVVAFLGFVGVMTVRNPPAFVSRTSEVLQPREPEETWRYVNADVLNVREGPGTDRQIVGVLYRNQRVLVEAVEDGWAKLVKPERGYVAARFVQDVPAQ